MSECAAKYRNRAITPHIERTAIEEDESPGEDSRVARPDRSRQSTLSISASGSPWSPISGVRKDSPAEGPVFARETGSRRSTARTISTRCKLPELCYESAGKAMTIEIERPTPAGIHNTLTITVTPDDTPLPSAGTILAGRRAGRRAGTGILLSDLTDDRGGARRLAGGQGRAQAGRRDQLDDAQDGRTRQEKR